ncbi:aa3-type cytochrome c oxidase subunit IV [Humitalea sp. 24SJ18S-53]|uniref:aa3-type cytochrome c oxidase subunit IV n=1 Tax=Humitalea sp. 24SJ18S-53 TaxID=3422307 RepID=UPI003D67A1F2
MAEQSHPVEFVEVRAQDILANREAAWESFGKAATYGIAAVAALLVLMLIFLV